MSDFLTITAALVLLGAVLLWLLHWYVESAAWWPLVGREWRAERADRLQLERTRREIADVPMPWEWPERITERWDEVEEPEDDEWADELHHMNLEIHRGTEYQPGQFGDLSRPVHELTHYEVEAVIVQLGRADWLPVAA